MTETLGSRKYMKLKDQGLTEKCRVCSAPAVPHSNYGAVVCFSCRAFFRRGVQQKYQCRQMCTTDNSSCGELNIISRTYCKKCRYDKCLEVGMKPELVDATLKNRGKTANMLFKCFKCDFYAETNKEVKEHNKFQHLMLNKKDPLDPGSGVSGARNSQFDIKDPIHNSLTMSLLCRFCIHTFSDMQELKHHLLDHLAAGQVSRDDLLQCLYVCKECEYVSLHQDDLDLHRQLLHRQLLHGHHSSSDDSSLSLEESFPPDHATTTNQRPVSGSRVHSQPTTTQHLLFREQDQEETASFFNFKCALCEFKTNFEDNVKEHFYTQHNV